MASNKKPRKAYKPKRTAKDPLAYMAKKDPADVEEELIAYQVAFGSILKGHGSVCDVDTVTAALNGCAVLCLQHDWMEYYDKAVLGQRAQQTMIERLKLGKRAVYTGPEMQAVREALEIWEAQLPIMTPRDMASAATLVGQQLVRRNFTKPL
jgi:hypothetical protein